MEIWTVEDYRGANVKGDGDQKKKRKRVSHTCTSCKSRKIKCDQGRPCSSCVKKNIPPHLCVYEDSPFIPSAQSTDDPKEAILLLKAENNKLKAEIEKLKRTSFSFPSSSSEGKPLRLPENLLLKKDRIVYNGSTNWRALLFLNDRDRRLIETARTYVVNAKKEWKLERNLKPVPSEAYNDLQTSSPDELLVRLASALPDNDTLRNYLDIYAHSYWCYTFPILDTTQLMSDFERMFQEGKIIVEPGSTDYSKVAVLLLCFKFAALTLNCAEADSNIDHTDHWIHYAEKLLEMTRIYTKSSIPTLRALILIHQMKMINPSDSNGSDTDQSPLLLRTAINMAILMGLNRNIDELYDHETEKSRERLKSIWRVLFREDAMLSFKVGIPLSIEDSYVDHSTIDFGNLRDDLTLIVREATRLLVKIGECKQDEVLRLIHKVETYNGGELVQISSIIRDLKSVDRFMSSFKDVTFLEDKILAIYFVHVLYETLLVGSESNDPQKDMFYNGTLKYGILAVTHLVEIMSKLNLWCKQVSGEFDASKKFKLYNIVQIASSISSISKLVFLKAHCTLYQHVLRLLFDSSKPPELPAEQIISFSVPELETLDVENGSLQLNKAFREPFFLRGLMTLSCKYMLQLNNESYGKVSNAGFCVSVLALYKYFDSVLQKRLPRDKLRELVVKIQPASESPVGGCNSRVTSEDILRLDSVSNGASSKSSLGHILTTDVPLINTPDSVSTQLDAPNLGFDFLDWKNDTIDELFNSLLTEDAIFAVDEKNSQIQILPLNKDLQLFEHWDPSSGTSI